MKKLMAFFIIVYLIHKLVIPINFEPVVTVGEKVAHAGIQAFMLFDKMVDQLLEEEQEGEGAQMQKPVEAEPLVPPLHLESEKTWAPLSRQRQEVHYRLLEPFDQQIYRRVVEGAKDSTEVVELLTRRDSEYDEYVEEDLERLVRIIGCANLDHPELVIATSYPQLIYTPGENMHSIKLREGIGQESYQTLKEEISFQLEEATEGILDPAMDEFEKISAIYHHVQEKIDYSGANEATSRSLEGPVLEGVGVCMSYALYLKALCDVSGIESAVITSHNHAWNLVRIYGEVYHVDATWDDTARREDWRYFLVSTDRLHELDSEGSHQFDTAVYFAF